jgi:hypothetical protein
MAKLTILRIVGEHKAMKSGLRRAFIGFLYQQFPGEAHDFRSAKLGSQQMEAARSV